MALTEQAKEMRKVYKREWNRKNRDKVKAAQERYWIRRAAAQWAAENTDEQDTQEA